MTFAPLTAAPRPAKPDDVWIPVRGKEAGHAADGYLTVAEAGDAALICVGSLDGDRLLWTSEAPAGVTTTLWSELFARPEFGQGPVLRAVQIMDWRAGHRYCGSCAAELADCAGYLSRKCPSCDRLYMVGLNPVVLVLVTHEERVLLVRHSYQLSHKWLLVSGYMESGETFELAAAREVFEETGVRLASLAYAGSGPSAFGDPHVLMAGFEGIAASPEVVVDPVEIEEARWFTREEVLALPEEVKPLRGVLGRELLDRWTAGG
ncbi:NADH pyrophosphatase [Actinorhabdospora filicis]|uniref:NAD(+) diphosphatase n=1 Tax=Actinorhabdospora filicis TaxID=1785913 RepID=A0A9W6SMS0_9ACTN|nr:NUDIX domain-containing protein [Actinorhabdospora filicis]GLZ79780.1 NADH pyrophosphatase [Actinorhabdospora filicis]